MILRNLSEPEVGKVLFDYFRAAINALTIHESGTSRIEGHIRLRDTRPFRTEPRGYPASQALGVQPHRRAKAERTAWNWPSPRSWKPRRTCRPSAKNYMAVGFKIDYVKADGELSTYTPDFIVRTTDGVVWIVETKGREELDVPQKMARLRQWCADATEASQGRRRDALRLRLCRSGEFREAQAVVVRGAGERFP